MKFSFIPIEAAKGKNLEEQLKDCMNQLEALFHESARESGKILCLNFFIASADTGTYNQQSSLVEELLPRMFSKSIPYTCLAQAPASGAEVSVEVCYVTDSSGLVLIPKTFKSQSYIVVQNQRDEKILAMNGIAKDSPDKNITGDAEEVFSLAHQILEKEGMNFGNIFRQWNYIEDITMTGSENQQTTQHYQLFNNVRSKYYALSDFPQGYPAATGIGVKAGGVRISFLASSGKGLKACSIENPLQKAAFQYTEDVLVGKTEYQGLCKCTPKFARAKLVANHESEQVFISGTASIREEVSVGLNDVCRQTEITIENMKKLICTETLTGICLPANGQPQIEFIRVYIKHKSDYNQVKQLCDQHLPGVPGIYVVSDVCRDNLLVEIEALASS